MKNNILSTLTITLIILINNVQPCSSKVGIKIGLNRANITSTDGIYDYEPILGFLFGGYMFYPINNSTAFQPEFIYTMKGSNEEFDGNKFSEYIDYLEIPLILKFYSKNKVNERFNIIIGPSVSLLLNAKMKIDYSKEIENLGLTDTTIDLKDNRKDIDLGMIIGVGYDYKSDLMFDIRYIIGLTNIGASDSYIDMKNRVISLTLNFKLQ